MARPTEAGGRALRYAERHPDRVRYLEERELDARDPDYEVVVMVRAGDR
jgi:hypothetical protein